MLQAGQAGGLTCAAFDPAGKRIVTGGSDGNLYVWDADQAMLVATLEWHGSETVNAVGFAPEGNLILSAGDDGTLKVGRCDVCGVSPDQLEARAAQLARLDTVAMQRLDEATDITVRTGCGPG